jgi:hypothetical protein
MADAATLEQKVARLREQSTALHRADTEALSETYRRIGQQKDDANQQLRAAQEAAKTAEAQAKEQHERAQDFEHEARTLEEGAKDEFNKVERISESNLEKAQKLRALAAAATERAAESHRDVARYQEDAQRFEQQVTALRTQIDLDGSPVEKLADQLDDMIDRAGQAAVYLREAERLDAAGDTKAAETMRGAARDELDLLGNITPAYRSVDPELLRRVGITAADTDLMDPTVIADATASDDPPVASTDVGDVLGRDDVADATWEGTDSSPEIADETVATTESTLAEDPWATTAPDLEPDPTYQTSAEVLQDAPAVAAYDTADGSGVDETMEDTWAADTAADDGWGGSSDG